MIRVLIVDDHAILRHGLRSLLADAFTSARFGEAANASEALEQLAKHEWDIALLDITMPGKSGLDLLRELKIAWPKLPVLMLSAHPEDQFAIRVRNAGAQGYMTKESAPEELVNAVRTILAGGQYVSPSLAETLAAPSLPQAVTWLSKNGPGELELLLQPIICRLAAPLLILDNDHICRDASSGAGKLLGLSRSELIGRSLQEGGQKGTLSLVGADGNLRKVEYTAQGNVLPARQLLMLHGKTAPAGTIAAWARDYALCLLNALGEVVAWYAGAERIYGYTGAEVIGRHVAVLYPVEDISRTRPLEELNRSAAGGHFVSEGWCMKKDGARFWANVNTLALKNENGDLQGFARIVRDFSGRQERDQQLLRARALMQPLPVETAIAGMVSGEFDRMTEGNQAFLDLVGYSREDLQLGHIRGLDLTPPEYFPLDELAHEESLRFGACTPFEKELIRKDGTRIPVVVASAVLNLLPFRWVSFIQDLSERDGQKVDHEVVEEGKNDFEEIIGRSPALKRLLGQVEVVAPTNATVLILGETGTGKELVARAVHRLSPRRERAFISLNCAAIPTGLLESELFGYERGAFTGALTQKIGRFEMAHKGTLFLDEVGDIPLDLQPKLLRALQEKSFERLGGTKTIPIDVRLVAATNRNLTQMMDEKMFRADLYYRLKVFPITTPPLRDHPEDIPLLARHFMQKYAREMDREIDKIPADMVAALVAWSWPGNVREFENFIERAVILTKGSSLRAPLNDIQPTPGPVPTGSSSASGGSGTLEQVEKEHIIRVLRDAGGIVSVAATRLGMPRTTLNAVMRKLGISRKEL